MDMSNKVKIICDDIEYELEMQDDKTILELALDNDIDCAILMSRGYMQYLSCKA